MHKQILFLSLSFCLAFAALFTNSAQAQATSEIPEFVLKAKDADTEIGMLLPAVQKVREAAAYVPVLEAAHKLAANVQKAGKGMTQAQYQGFQRELAKIEADLDKIAGGTSSSSGAPAPGTVGACHKSCHDAFGNGFGGGKGWNRFICKLGCIKVNLPGGGSVGG